jgi:hypothetical protein
VAGVALVVALIFIEVRLRALFARHEKREEQLHASSALMADAAAALAREAARRIEELRIEAAGAKLDIENLGQLLKLHDGRLKAIEERLLRAALLIPGRIRSPEGA